MSDVHEPGWQGNNSFLRAHTAFGLAAIHKPERQFWIKPHALYLSVYEGSYSNVGVIYPTLMVHPDVLYGNALNLRHRGIPQTPSTRRFISERESREQSSSAREMA